MKDLLDQKMDKPRQFRKSPIFSAVISGYLSIDEAERINAFLKNNIARPSISTLPPDPIEAARIYQEIMQRR